MSYTLTSPKVSLGLNIIFVTTMWLKCNSEPNCLSMVYVTQLFNHLPQSYWAPTVSWPHIAHRRLAAGQTDMNQTEEEKSPTNNETS